MNTNNRDSLVHEHILASMSDGVVSIDQGGRILAFNAAAGAILGKEPEAVLGRSFAECFLEDERLDDFNEVVLQAIYESEIRHRVPVRLDRDGERRDLIVSSSFLRASRAADGERLGVVVVVADVTEERKRRKIKRLFGEYVDPRIVEHILAREEAQETLRRRETMTISFVDMRDFTGWSERLSADRLIELLNRYLSAVTTPIGAAGGLTDKFIGDAVMACWGPPFSDAATQARDACEAALGQIAALPELGAGLAADGYEGAERIDAVVGIATGEVICGDIGPHATRNFTVIGRAVNTAARLQAAAKHYGQHILVSERTARDAGERFVFREIDRMVLRGQHEAERVFSLLGRAGEVDASARELAARHEAGLAAARAGERDRAAAAFRACLDLDPADRPAALLLARLAAPAEAAAAGAPDLEASAKI